MNTTTIIKTKYLGLNLLKFNIITDKKIKEEY